MQRTQFTNSLQNPNQKENIHIYFPLLASSFYMGDGVKMAWEKGDPCEGDSKVVSCSREALIVRVLFVQLHKNINVDFEI